MSRLRPRALVAATLLAACSPAVLASPVRDQAMPARAATADDDFPREIAEVLREGLGDRLRAPGPVVLDSFTDDAVLEFPFAPDPAARRVVGRAAAHAFYARLNRVLALESATLDKSYAVTGGADALLEYRAVARDLRTGRAAPQQFIATVTLRGDRISHLREYFGPPPATPNP